MVKHFYKDVIFESPMGYALHQMVYDEKGVPCDYIFIEVNNAFEEFTGLKGAEIAHKNITEVLPDLKKGSFDWIGYYGDVALGGPKKEFVQYAEGLDRWYKISVFSPEKDYFVTLFVDISNERKQYLELESFFEINLDLLLISNFEGILLKVNKEWEVILGYNKAELEGKNFMGFVHPDDVEATKKQMENLINGEPVLFFVNRYRRRDGTYRSIEWRVRSKETLLYAAARDITEELQNKQEIQRQKEFFELVVHGSNDGVWDINPLTDEIYFSPRWKGQLGYLDDEFPNSFQVFQDTIHPEDKDILLINYYAYLKGDKDHYDLEFRLRHKDGSYKWMRTRGAALRDENGKAYRIAGSHTDITERKEMENRIIHERERLEEIIESTRVGTWEWNIQTGEEKVNTRWAEIIGYTLEELYPITAQTWIENTHPDDVKKSQMLLERHKSGELKYYQTESRMKHKDGSWVWVLDRGRISRYSPDGAPLLMYGTHQDITAQKQVEAELVRAKEEAETANVMKSRFLANMSHEIRSPMNGIMGYLELLQTTKLTKEQREFTQLAKSSSELLLYLINDILDFSRIEAGKLSIEKVQFQVYKVVEETVEGFKPKTLQKNIQIHTSISPNVPSEVIGDPSRLRQVLNNLISNAVKFTHDGSISIHVESLRDAEDKAVLSFQVKDTGIGIEKSAISQLFKPFVQADETTTRRYGGTGLGLAISKELVKLMKGEIKVQSQVGEGSTFEFTAQFDRINGADRENVIEQLKGLHVLVVDSKEREREILVSQLRSVGCLVDEVSSAEKAILNLLSKASHGEKVDLTIVNYKMSDMNGYQLSRALKSMPNTKNVKLILTCSPKDQCERGTALENGYEELVIKPISKEVLINRISNIIDNNPDAQSIEMTTTNYFEVLQPKILLVEDSSMNQELIIKVLKTKNLTCDLADDGEEALKAILKNNYDVVFMDCQMPVMDGYECTAKIRELEGAKRHTAIIAMTANAMEGDRNRCIDAGMDDYISKPINFKQMFKLIDVYTQKTGVVSAHYDMLVDYIQRFGENNQLDTDDIKELIDFYLKNFPSKLADMEEAVKNEEFIKIKQLAHQVKGSTGSVGIDPIWKLAEKLELAAMNQDIEACKLIWESIFKLFH